MLKVQILDRCPHCRGVSMVFVDRDTDHNGKPYDRFRLCFMCDGSGNSPRWVSLDKFRKLLQQTKCPHEHISTRGGMHFCAGDVWDDIEEICDDCGATLDT